MVRGRLVAMLHYDIPVYINLYFNPCNFASNCRPGLIFSIWVCVHVSEFLLCVCVRLCVSVFVCVSVRASVYTCVWVCRFVSVYLWVCVSLCVYISLCVRVCY